MFTKLIAIVLLSSALASANCDVLSDREGNVGSVSVSGIVTDFFGMNAGRVNMSGSVWSRTEGRVGRVLGNTIYGRNGNLVGRISGGSMVTSYVNGNGGVVFGPCSDQVKGGAALILIGLE